MTATQIILEINKLPFSERISIIENTLKSLRNQEKKKLEMKKAAKLLLDDYLNDSDLTAFSSLEYEDFYETK
jgi:hypothetical protein